MPITLNDIEASFHSIAISDGTDTLAIAADGSIAVTDNGASLTVDATNLDIRDLTSASDSVEIKTAAGQALAIDGSGYLTTNVNGSVTVTASDLDVRDLTHVSDSIKVGDGTDFLAIAADGSIAVTDNGTTLSIDDGGGSLTVDFTRLAHGTDSVKVGDGTDFLAVNADGSINVTSVPAGYSSWQTAAVSVGNTATQLDATPLANRLSCVIQNLGGQDIWVGPANTVTTSNGLKIPKGSSQEILLDAGGTIWGITSAGSSDIRFAEYAN